MKKIEINTLVWKNCLTRDEEYVIVSNDDMGDSHSIVVTRSNLSNNIWSIIKILNPQKSNTNIKKYFIENTHTKCRTECE